MKYVQKQNNNELNIGLELGYSAGIYINEYIHGNEIYDINEFIEEFKGTVFYTKYLKKYILKLKEHVQLGNKINIIGIDIEHQKHIAEKVLKYVNNEEDLLNIQSNIKYAEKIRNFDDISYEIAREEYLYSNFNKYFKDTECICFMGAYHTSLVKKDEYNTNPLCTRLKSELNNILSIEIKYINTNRKIKNGNDFEIIKVNDAVEKNVIEFNEIYIDEKNICVKNGIEI